MYKKLGDGVLAKCISEDLGMEILTKVHSEVCGLEGPTLAQRIQRMGYFWPEMRKKTAKIHKNCEQCQMVIDVGESYFVEKEDWRQQYINYFVVQTTSTGYPYIYASQRECRKIFHERRPTL